MGESIIIGVGGLSPRKVIGILIKPFHPLLET
jgi:hypothetical protein